MRKTKWILAAAFAVGGCGDSTDGRGMGNGPGGFPPGGGDAGSSNDDGGPGSDGASDGGSNSGTGSGGGNGSGSGATTGDSSNPSGGGGTTGASSTDTSDGGGPKFDVGGGGTGTGTGSATGTATGSATGSAECDPGLLPTPDATLEGTVYAPNLEIPISGALVYLTHDPVDPIPDGLYCAECVTLSCSTHYVLTEPDGSFSLPAQSGAGQKLVVQKGQFLRVIDFTVSPGVNPVPATSSNLPGAWNPAAGEWIPRIAVYDTYPDKVSNVLAKFGMGQVDAGGNLMLGTENFALVDDSDQGAFMDDLAMMSQYHIIFVPCAATKYWLGAPTVPAARAQNIQDYVDGGGKWYATDHSNEYIKEPFPSYQDFYAPTMPDIQPAYTVNGTVVDAEMLAWLNALPPNLKDIGGGNPTLNTLPSVQLMLNYTGIEAVHPVIVLDMNNNPVDVGHKTWVEGPCTSCSADPNRIRPMAVTGQYGCGRMMYSTFENSSTAHVGLNPQELVLLYMILEIGVCHDKTPPPPPG